MISYTKILTVFTIGILSTILLMLMVYAGFSQFFIDNILHNLDVSSLAMAAVIVLSFVFIALVSSFAVSMLVTTKVDKNRVFWSSIFSFSLTFILTFGISVLIIGLAFPHLIDDLPLSGIDYVLVLPPICIFYVSVYVFEEFIFLIITIVIFYFFVFVSFLWTMVWIGKKDLT